MAGGSSDNYSDRKVNIRLNIIDGDQNDAGALNEESQQLPSRNKSYVTSNAVETSSNITVSVQGKGRKATKVTIFVFIVIFALETIVNKWIHESGKYYEGKISLKIHLKSREYYRHWQKSSRGALNQDDNACDSISDAIKIEYDQWRKLI